MAVLLCSVVRPFFLFPFFFLLGFKKFSNAIDRFTRAVVRLSKNSLTFLNAHTLTLTLTHSHTHTHTHTHTHAHTLKIQTFVKQNEKGHMIHCSCHLTVYIAAGVLAVLSQLSQNSVSNLVWVCLAL